MIFRLHWLISGVIPGTGKNLVNPGMVAEPISALNGKQSIFFLWYSIKQPIPFH